MKTAEVQAAFCAYSCSVRHEHSLSRPVGAAAVMAGRHGLGFPVHHLSSGGDTGFKVYATTEGDLL